MYRNLDVGQIFWGIGAIIYLTVVVVAIITALTYDSLRLYRRIFSNTKK